MILSFLLIYRYETGTDFEDHLPEPSPEMRSRKVRYHLSNGDDTLIFMLASLYRDDYLLFVTASLEMG